MRGWGKQAPVEACSPSGLPKGPVGVGCNAVQPRRAALWLGRRPLPAAGFVLEDQAFEQRTGDLAVFLG